MAQVPAVLWFGLRVPRLAEAIAGAAFIVAGCALNVWAVLHFRRNEAGVCPFSPVSNVVREGPYRFTRNPMYLGLVLIAAGAALASGFPENLWSPAVLAVWLHYKFIRPEEDFLQERLSTSYLVYASRTPRWLA